LGRIVRLEVDVGVASGEADEVPGLPLALEPPAPELAVQFGRKVVKQLLGQPGEDLEVLGPRADFLAELAKHRRVDILAVVDAALRHLPPVAFAVVNPLADESLAPCVDQHHADAWAIGKGIAWVHVRRDRAKTVGNSIRRIAGATEKLDCGQAGGNLAGLYSQMSAHGAPAGLD